MLKYSNQHPLPSTKVGFVRKSWPEVIYFSVWEGGNSLNKNRLASNIRMAESLAQADLSGSEAEQRYIGLLKFQQYVEKHRRNSFDKCSHIPNVASGWQGGLSGGCAFYPPLLLLDRG